MSIIYSLENYGTFLFIPNYYGRQYLSKNPATVNRDKILFLSIIPEFSGKWWINTELSLSLDQQKLYK